MFKIVSIFMLVCVVSVNCQAWAQRACLVNGNDYLVKTLQEAINRIEKDVKWCNFKLVDVSTRIDERLFKWHALGTANYTDGFLLSFQKLDITNIQVRFYTTSVNGTSEDRLMASGALNFRDVRLGYNVEAHMEDSGIHHFTGIFPYTTVTITCSIIKNIITNEISVSTSMASSPASRRMNYLPHNNVSDVLSRHFSNFDINPSFYQWGREIIAPVVEEVASQIGIPSVRFDNKC